MKFFEINREKRFMITVSNTILFVVTLLISEYRHLFGVIKGYAPYEFAFNLIFFLPIMIIVLIIAIILFSKTISERKNYNNKICFYSTLLFNVPILLFWSWLLVRMILFMLNSSF